MALCVVGTDGRGLERRPHGTYSADRHIAWAISLSGIRILCKRLRKESLAGAETLLQRQGAMKQPKNLKHV